MKEKSKISNKNWKACLEKYYEKNKYYSLENLNLAFDIFSEHKTKEKKLDLNTFQIWHCLRFYKKLMERFKNNLNKISTFTLVMDIFILLERIKDYEMKKIKVKDSGKTIELYIPNNINIKSDYNYYKHDYLKTAKIKVSFVEWLVHFRQAKKSKIEFFDAPKKCQCDICKTQREY